MVQSGVCSVLASWASNNSAFWVKLGDQKTVYRPGRQERAEPNVLMRDPVLLYEKAET